MSNLDQLPKLEPDHLPVVPQRQAHEEGSPDAQVAAAVHDHSQTEQVIARIETDVTKLGEHMGVGLSAVRRAVTYRRRTRELKAWLQHQGYTDKTSAKQTLEAERGQAHQRMDKDMERISALLPEVRARFGAYPQNLKDQADELLRENDLPAAVVQACEEQAKQTGREKANLADWFASTPTAKDPFGATDKELVEVLAWNAAQTERFAADPERLRQMVRTAIDNVRTRVASGELDPAWDEAVPLVTRVVVGDILDAGFLQNRIKGTYNYQTGELTVWPYVTSSRSNNDAHTVQHEVGHAYGGFALPPLDEGANDICARIAEGTDPYVKDVHYYAQRMAVKTMLDFCGVAPRDMSRFLVASKDRESNQKQLGRLLAERAGANVIEIAELVYWKAYFALTEEQEGKEAKDRISKNEIEAVASEAMDAMFRFAKAPEINTRDDESLAAYALTLPSQGLPANGFWGMLGAVILLREQRQQK